MHKWRHTTFHLRLSIFNPVVEKACCYETSILDVHMNYFNLTLLENEAGKYVEAKQPVTKK